MRSFKWGVATALALATVPHAAFADDYKDQLKTQNYLDLIKIDPATLDKKQRKSYEDVRRKRDEQAQRAYVDTRFTSDDFKASKSLISPAGFGTTSQICKQESECLVVIQRSFDNTCGRYNDYKFCDFSSAYARGGTQVSIKRTDFDVKTTPRTERVVRPKSCTDCRDMSYDKVTYSTRYSESYQILVPLKVVRDAAQTGSLAIKLSGQSDERLIGLDQESLIGFLKRFDEAKGQLWQ